MRMRSRSEGKGPPVVLVPGGLTGWITWAEHAEHLARARRVVRVQLLNVELGLDGRSLPPDYSVRLEARAMAAALDAEGVAEPADVVAWSYGGAIALEAALFEPRRFRTLTLIEPSAYWVLPSRTEEERALLEADRRISRVDVTEEALAEFLLRAGFVPEGSDPRAAPRWDVWARHRQSLRASAAEVAHAGDREALRKLAVPILLVKGTGSTSILHRTVDELGRALPRARVVELPGGHAAHLADPEGFRDLLLRFHSRPDAPLG